MILADGSDLTSGRGCRQQAVLGLGRLGEARLLAQQALRSHDPAVMNDLQVNNSLSVGHALALLKVGSNLRVSFTTRASDATPHCPCLCLCLHLRGQPTSRPCRVTDKVSGGRARCAR